MIVHCRPLAVVQGLKTEFIRAITPVDGCMKRLSRSFIYVVVAMGVAGSIPRHMAAQEASAGKPNPIQTPVLQTPLPTGPYASWPEDLKKKAVAALAFRCAMVSGMQFGNYKGPGAAAKEMVQALSAACVDHQMPDDWPGHAEFRETIRHHFEVAHGLDSSLEMPPDSVWSHFGS